MEFWIPWAVFRIPKPRIPVSTTQIFQILDFTSSKNFPDSLNGLNQSSSHISLKLISVGGSK